MFIYSLKNNDSINIYCLFSEHLIQLFDMKYLILLIPFFTITDILADSRLKTSNYDLRSHQLILSVQVQGGNHHSLFKTAGEEYFVDRTMDKKTSRVKISNTEAENYDAFFVSQFIHIKYSMPNFQGKNCSNFYTLSMRGETQNVCKEESDKLKVMDELINKLIVLTKK